MSKPPLDVQTIIDERFSPCQRLLLALCFLVVAVDGFDTAAVGYIAPALVQEWGVPRAALGPVLSAALFGLALGALSAGPLADRYGRKSVLLASVLFFGAGSLASAFAATLEQLTALRFLTGLGLGAAMPNAVTLMSEFAPARYRAVLVNAMFCGFPLGASAGGVLASWLIPHYGWRSVLLLGGLAPLGLAVPLWRYLPESVRHMAAHGAPAARIRGVLERIAGRDLSAEPGFVAAEPALGGRSAVGVVLAPAYRLGSLMLWLAYFMGLLIFYLLTSWLPILIKDAGFTISQAALMTALFPLGGGIGTLAAGYLMDRFNPNRVVALGYALTAALIFAVGQGTATMLSLGGLIFLAGTAMNGAQSSMPALAAGFYPTHGRATGVAWMLGIGRFGGIAGALLGGELLRRQLELDTIFALLAIPAALATAALLCKQRFAAVAAPFDAARPATSSLPTSNEQEQAHVDTRSERG
ncbi:MFS transporter [Chromobacterium haemolyticum]|uniref:MFS transporter n=1 Tax=Chromobacterium haemolyticum TaxID=394935 RepID=UPI000D31DEDC|nr:MFS transporter [Chromobacterium haemolyticum]PTU69196.1 aromatic acid/H+ symport family MFS transporter [Chromobacterium haemolyticum]BBH13016.1 MFS transporter [Chromobacterium haemolyticum]